MIELITTQPTAQETAQLVAFCPTALTHATGPQRTILWHCYLAALTELIENGEEQEFPTLRVFLKDISTVVNSTPMQYCKAILDTTSLRF